MKMQKDQAKICYVKHLYLYFQVLSIGSSSLEHFIKRDCEVGLVEKCALID